MKITIDATPTELAKLIIALVDYDVDVDDDEDEDDEDEDEDDAAIIRRAKLEVANAVLTALTRAVHKTAT